MPHPRCFLTIRNYAGARFLAMTDKLPARGHLLFQILICSCAIVFFSLHGVGGTSNAASLSITVRPPLLDIHADQVPLFEILKALSHETGIAVESRDLLEDLVSLDLKGVTVEACLQRLLKQKNYALTYAKTGKDVVPVRIMVYGHSDLQRFEAASAAPSAEANVQPDDHLLKNYQKSWFAGAVKDSDRLAGQIAVESIEESDTSGPGLRIQSVKPGSLFYLIGLRKGDQIQDVNGKTVKTARELVDLLKNFSGQTPSMIRIARKDTNPIYIELH